MLRCAIRSAVLVSSLTLLALSAILLDSIPLASAQSDTTTVAAKQHYQNAVAAIAKSDWQTAKAELIQAERLAPKNALVHYDLALACSHTGSTKAAQSEINKALQLGLPAEQTQAAERMKSNLENPALPSGAENSEQDPEEPDKPALRETLDYINSRFIPVPDVFRNARLVLSDDHERLSLLYENNPRGRWQTMHDDCFVSDLNGGSIDYRLFLGSNWIDLHGKNGVGSMSVGPYSLETEQVERIVRAYRHLIALLLAEHKAKQDQDKDPFAK